MEAIGRWKGPECYWPLGPVVVIANFSGHLLTHQAALLVGNGPARVAERGLEPVPLGGDLVLKRRRHRLAAGTLGGGGAPEITLTAAATTWKPPPLLGRH
jgi:hypothetical protein